MWAPTGEMDGRQRDFLQEVRTFHTTGSYSSPDQLRERLAQRFAGMASAARLPWCKVGAVLFRVRRYRDDGTRIRVEASARDDHIIAGPENLWPDDWQRQSSRITCMGRSHAVEINTVVVEATAARSRLVRIEATKVREQHDWLLDSSVQGWSPEDLTELAIRTAFLGDRILSAACRSWRRFTIRHLMSTRQDWTKTRSQVPSRYSSPNH